MRNEILGQLKRNAVSWFELALGRAPMELQSTLQVGGLDSMGSLIFIILLDRNT